MVYIAMISCMHLKKVPGYSISYKFTDIAELVINNECVKFERFLVNSKNFKIKLDYKFVDDDGHNW